MKRWPLGPLLLLAACQSAVERDYPGPWQRLSPEGLAALNATLLTGVGSCVERRHAMIANQFLLACSYDHYRWTGMVLAPGQQRPIASYGQDVIAELGIPSPDLLPARSRSQQHMDAMQEDMNARQAAEAGDQSGK